MIEVNGKYVRFQGRVPDIAKAVLEDKEAPASIREQAEWLIERSKHIKRSAIEALAPMCEDEEEAINILLHSSGLTFEFYRGLEKYIKEKRRQIA